ncbi:chaperone NapD [Ferrimonas pelagia]
MDYHVASLILELTPSRRDTVLQYINQLEGAEVHGLSDDHQLVVTLEGEQNVLSRMEAMHTIPGVISVSLVSHHIEPAC